MDNAANELQSHRSPPRLFHEAEAGHCSFKARTMVRGTCVNFPYLLALEVYAPQQHCSRKQSYASSVRCGMKTTTC